ncbi:hypothetical protein GUJ93_ZPchr0006g43477 [Zizania palustris]|uniref:Uncharacterized protein n=1 Tax=Zizania palustris TaxID=103762 RepID=A0A8J5W2F9_ZIZPA|nr:hypothetical protein GUJ93_ZPchr0006g43477 [Zizania palustris]
MVGYARVDTDSVEIVFRVAYNKWPFSSRALHFIAKYYAPPLVALVSTRLHFSPSRHRITTSRFAPLPAGCLCVPEVETTRPPPPGQPPPPQQQRRNLRRSREHSSLGQMKALVDGYFEE